MSRKVSLLFTILLTILMVMPVFAQERSGASKKIFLPMLSGAGLAVEAPSEAADKASLASIANGVKAAERNHFSVPVVTNKAAHPIRRNQIVLYLALIYKSHRAISR